MESKIKVFISFLLFSFATVAQSDTAIKKESINIIKLFLNRDIDSLVNSYYPSYKNLKTIQGNIQLSKEDYFSQKQQVKNWLKEPIYASEDSVLNSKSFVIDSIEVKSKKATIVHFSIGTNSFKGNLYFILFNNKYLLDPSGGLSYRKKY